MRNIGRWLTRYQQGGLKGLGQALARRVGHWQQRARGWRWFRSRVGRRWVPTLWPMRLPRLVILSLPRSGSSWVGSLVGSAGDAAYLREPFTATYIKAGHKQAVFEFPPQHPPEAYRRAAALAYDGIPDFPAPPEVAVYPAQWRARERKRRRVVIKEINPYAAPWLTRDGQTRCILLVRHPAAIALSYKKRGWGVRQPWAWFGDHFGHALAAAWQHLANYPHTLVMTYEELCQQPVAQFARLFAFAGLTWDAAAEAAIVRSTSGASGRLARNSQAMARQ